MKGVVDIVAVTIDSTEDSFLTEIGRNFGRYKEYYKNIMNKCSLISKAGIELKFHSVISTKNHLVLSSQVKDILNALGKCWGQLILLEILSVYVI